MSDDDYTHMAKALLSAEAREERFRLAELVASLGGDPKTELARLKPMFDLAEKARAKKRSAPHVLDIVAIALTVRDVGMNDDARIDKAFQILESSTLFLRDRSRKLDEIRSLTPSSAPAFIDLYQGRPSFEVPSYIVEMVADYDLGDINTFDDWLKMIMPNRAKRNDRVERLRRYIRENDGLFLPPASADSNAPSMKGDDLVNMHFERFEKMATRGIWDMKLRADWLHQDQATVIKRETILFLAWDRAQTTLDRTNKAKKAARVRHGASKGKEGA